MNKQLDEHDILSLEQILENLKEVEWNTYVNHEYPLIGVDIEYLEHIMAKLKNGTCKDCGEVFKKENIE